MVTSLLKCQKATSKNIFDSDKSASELSTRYILYIYIYVFLRLFYTLQVVRCPSILTYHDIQDDKLFIAILLIESYLFKRIENLKTFENIFQKIERIVTKYE